MTTFNGTVGKFQVENQKLQILEKDGFEKESENFPPIRNSYQMFKLNTMQLE